MVGFEVLLQGVAAGPCLVEQELRPVIRAAVKVIIDATLFFPGGRDQRTQFMLEDLLLSFLAHITATTTTSLPVIIPPVLNIRNESPKL